MKKILAYILASFYLLISIGAVSHAHICHGNITSFTLYEDSKKCDNELPSNSSCCSSTDKNTSPFKITKKECCINATNLLKYETLTEFTVEKVKTYITEIRVPVHILTTIKPQSEDYSKIKSLLDFSPPIKAPKYSLLCSYIYYG